MSASGGGAFSRSQVIAPETRWGLGGEVPRRHPWVDVILARINPGGMNVDQEASIADVRATLVRARRNGKAVINMKVHGSGT